MSKPNADDHMDVDPHIEKRFELVKLVGKGAYGIVWRAIDRKTRQVVALKKVFDGFSNQTDAQRTYREVMFLQRLHHDNIVRLLGVHKAENHTDLYLVFEFIDTDLYNTIKTNLLQDIHKKFVTYQLLRCVRFLHKRGLIHRDLKPANLLLNSDCHAKLGDFGLARSLVQLERDGPKQVLTDYIATRWYRPPEIVTGSTYYSRGVDMWGIGCVIGEMLTGKPLLPGSSTQNQMERIVQMCGMPSSEDVKALRSPYADELLRKMKRLEPRPLKQSLAMYDKDAVDLMTKLLVFNPDKRISAAEAMCHPYVAQFSTPEELVPDDGPVTDPILLPVPDANRLDISDYREALYREMTKQKREAREKKLAKVRGNSEGGRAGSSASGVSGTTGAAAENKSHEEAAPGSGKDGIVVGTGSKPASGTTTTKPSPYGSNKPSSALSNKNSTASSGLGAVINKAHARVTPTPQQQNQNQNDQQQPTTSSTTTSSSAATKPSGSGTNNMINGSIFKGNTLMTTKALKKRTIGGAGNTTTTTNSAFPSRQMASTPAPTTGTTTTSMLLNHHNNNNNNGGSNSTIPPSRQPLGTLKAGGGHWPSQQQNNNNTGGGHQYFSSGNSNNNSNVGGTRKPLPSELLYAGRSTPQPNSTTTTTSAGIFGYRNNNNSSYASPLVAQFPNNNNRNGNNNNGLQVTVKPATIFSQNTTSATSWNQQQNNNKPSSGPLAPISNTNQSVYSSSSYLQNNNSNANNNNHSVYSKPGALGGGGRANGAPRVTSKLRQMVNDAQNQGPSGGGYSHKF